MLRDETPPPPANRTVDEPPASSAPTTAMLKADIDSGSTGDKVAHYDVGLSPLGTDDEAAGLPPSPERIALARKAEAASSQVRARADVHGERSWVKPVFFAVPVAIAVVVGLSLWLL
jgi:hypothetical protein